MNFAYSMPDPNIVECEECGREYRRQRKDNRFCSDECRGRHHQRVKLQRRIESGSYIGDGFCKYGEHCERCPERDCIATKFAVSY